MERLPLIVMTLLLAAFLLSVGFRLLKGYAVRRYGLRRWRAAYRGLHAVRTNRFKLTRKQRVCEALQRDPAIRAALLDHAEETGESLAEAEGRVRHYLDEIIPAFDLVSYYRLGLPIASLSLNAIYKLYADTAAVPHPKELHRENAVVYVFNHRSNADFVFASYALNDRVQLSYAVGEWARVWPLEKLFKSFGSYFVRRGCRVRLYHRVLRRYVQTVTLNGVTQGIFLEGGLSRDGWFRAPKAGLLDALLQVIKEPGFDKDIVFVPGAVNYDRVLEDRSLTAEAHGEKPERSILRMARKTMRILFRNSLKLAFRRVRKHGYAALRLGAPISLRAYLAEHGRDLIDLEREARGPVVQTFAEHLMANVQQVMPVCAVPLTCLALERLELAALQEDLLEEAEELRAVLEGAGVCVVREDKPVSEIVSYAVLLMEMRGTLLRDAGGVLRVRPDDEPLVRYYARSIAHLLPAGTPARFERSIM